MSAHKRFRRQIREAIKNGQTDLEGIDIPKGMRTRHMKKAVAAGRGLSTGVVSGRFVAPQPIIGGSQKALTLSPFGAPEPPNGPEVSEDSSKPPDGNDGGSP